MDVGPLRTWLGLPPGPWPPPPHALLGLPPGADRGRVEGRVMELMAVLRRHQLQQPDLVTEGMNRLAQALVVLSRDDEPIAEVSRVAPGKTLPDGDADAGSSDATLEIDVRDAGFKATAEPATAVMVSPRAAPLPKSRRGLYRHLVAVRRCLRAWDRLGLYLGHPHEYLDRPAAVFDWMTAVAEARGLRPLLRDFVGRVGVPGDITLALLDTPHPAHTLRSLLLDQREAVAVDWRKGRAALTDEQQRLRAAAARPRGLTWVRSVVLVKRRLERDPEWALVALLGVAALIAAWWGGGR